MIASGEEQNKRLRPAVLIFNVLCLAVSGVDGDTRLLMNHVLKDYQKGARPVVSEDTTIHVSHEAVPFHIISFDEVIQKLKISVWIRMAWSDEFLTWNPDDFNGTESFYLAGSLIWKPDIILYQNVDETSSYTEEKSYPAKLHHNGYVTYDVPGILHIYCRVDLTHYPFDTQRCQLKFSSWVHHVKQINLTSPVAEGELTEFQHDGEWDLLGMKVNRNLVSYHCCRYPIADVTYTLVLRRKPDFYVTNIIIPYVLLTCLSVLVFFLPAESGEKVALSVTTLLSLIVFNQLVTTTIPPASDTFPILGKYFIVMVGVVASAVAASVLVIATYHHHSSGLPINPVIRWIIFDILARMVGMKRVGPSCSQTRQTASRISDSEGIIPHSKLSMKRSCESAPCGNARKAEPKGIRYLSEVLAYDNSTGFPVIDKIQFGTNLPMPETAELRPEMMELGPENKSRLTLRMEKEMTEVTHRMRYLTLLKESKETHRYISKQWKEAALILDRVFFWFFTLLVALLPTVFLMKTKQII